MSGATDELINAYLAELEREAARLPWNARTELLEDVRSHIEVAVAEIREAGAAAAGGAGAEEGAAAGGGAVAAGESDSLGDLRARDVLGACDSLSEGAIFGEAGSVSEFREASVSGEPASSDETAQVRAMLAALGEPGEIVAAALADDPAASAPGGQVYQAYPDPDPTSAGFGPYHLPTRQSPPYPLGTADISAIALLLLGGFLVGIGWLVGVVLLWTSTRWTRVEKLIGTLILPGGIAGGWMALMWPAGTSGSVCDGTGHCTTTETGWHPPSWLAAVLAVAVLLATVATAVFLANRARQRPGLAPVSRMGLAIVAGVGTVGLLAGVGLLFASSTSGVRTGVSPTSVSSSSGDPVSGYVIPVSSPAQQSSSVSTP